MVHITYYIVIVILHISGGLDFKVVYRSARMRGPSWRTEHTVGNTSMLKVFPKVSKNIFTSHISLMSENKVLQK